MTVIRVSEQFRQWHFLYIFRSVPIFHLKNCRRWIHDSYSYWNDVCQSSDAASAGVAELSAYMFSSTDAGNVRVSWIQGWIGLFSLAEVNVCIRAESFFGKTAATLSCVHWRRTEVVSWQLEVWFILHNDIDRMSHVDALGCEKVSYWF